MLIVTSTLLCQSETWASTDGSSPIDCPLRDAPFSLDSPLIDVLLSPAAKSALENTFPLDKLPPGMLSTETPTFGAIVTVRNFAGFTGVPEDALVPLAKELAGIEVTDSDRAARCARYDNDEPDFNLRTNGLNVLVFHKINGFDHSESVVAATDTIQAIVEQEGWTVAVTDRAGAFTPDTLAQDYTDANHYPELVVNGIAGLQPVTVAAKPGDTISVTAEGSSDPDGDTLMYRWWAYDEAEGKGLRPQVPVTLHDDNTMQVQVELNENAPAGTYHIILETTDNGDPTITVYRRILLTVIE